ncbi:MAG: cytochrome ubiquinol oxidase subunit I [Gemmatimonadaceae bacterium]|nr:cytochrome ubiquinol oxidase subunit I [Gemmatimonadaceae bacterium]NUR36381.1 cytochrome ubiquinol oxidase subunit I [Gemmatimonadaceae bacterium]
MSDLLAARSQMAMSLGFHIVFAEIGIAMPLLMVLAEWRWRRTGDAACHELARRWAKGTAVLFAVGAVSGTVLSFELGLLWPGFMRFAGPLIGLPFSLEGFAFFLEAIFLGVYLYGWDRVGARAHLASGMIVAASGAASAVFVVLVNAWMNAPTGYELGADGRFVHIDPVAAMQSPAAAQQALHMLLAAYAATGLAVAGVHAAMLLRDGASAFHRRGLAIALLVGAPAAVLQPLSGDLSARVVALTQPVKLAALEGQWRTERGAPLRIGGLPDAAREQTRWALEIPYGLSLLAFHDPAAEVRGLTAVAREDRPPVAVVHIAFQTMVALGTIMALVALWAGWTAWRRDVASDRRLLRALVVVAPFGFIATEAGWIVTEVGRQPWVVQGLMRTATAVTPMPGLVVPLVCFTLLYLGLAAIVVALVASLVRESRTVRG